MRKIKWRVVGLLLSVFVLLACFVPGKNTEASTPDKRALITKVTLETLKEGHYMVMPINDEFSSRCFTIYLERLDFAKRFLLKEDVDKLKKFEKKIDDELNANSFEFLELSNSIIDKRTKEAEVYYKEILASAFDFNKDEDYETDPKKSSFAATKNELKDSWRKFLKYQTLVRVIETNEIQEKAIEKKDTTVKIKSASDIEADARNKVLKTMNDYFNRLKKTDDSDRLSLYLNAVASAYDPHTDFFPPKDKENFDIAMSGRLEGIGAQLVERDGYVKVSSIVPGSASWKQGQLKAEDMILKVAQGSAEPVEVTDMRLDDVVKLIRGKKGTEVRLTVKKPDATIHIISIIRDVVVLEDTYAKSTVIEKDGAKVGYIYLPQFYADFGQHGGRTCSQDVKNEIIKLKEQNVEGIILDLRNNGGGSLQDVVDMFGLFIDRGPVVGVRSRNSMPYELSDKDFSVLYNGPLTVMVNTISASASEIFAAAVQDYKRGVVIGGNSTFGKGTVQRVYDLDEALPRDYASYKPIGSLKLTVQKFYRVNGGATQLRGVVPDVILPDYYNGLDIGEKDEQYPLPWDETPPLRFTSWQNAVDISSIKQKSAQRVSNNNTFKLIAENAERLKKESDNTRYTLNMEKYRADAKRRKEESKKYDDIQKEIENISIKVLPMDLQRMQADSSFKTRTEAWHKNIKKDAYIDEAVNVIRDMVK